MKEGFLTPSRSPYTPDTLAPCPCWQLVSVDTLLEITMSSQLEQVAEQVNRAQNRESPPRCLLIGRRQTTLRIPGISLCRGFLRSE